MRGGRCLFSITLDIASVLNCTRVLANSYDQADKMMRHTYRAAPTSARTSLQTFHSVCSRVSLLPPCSHLLFLSSCLAATLQPQHSPGGRERSQALAAASQSQSSSRLINPPELWCPAFKCTLQALKEPVWACYCCYQCLVQYNKALLIAIRRRSLSHTLAIVNSVCKLIRDSKHSLPVYIHQSLCISRSWHTW